MGCISVHIEDIKGIGNASVRADEMKVSASATGMKVSIGVVCDVGELVTGSCFGAGYWVNEKPWINNEGWKNK